MEEKIITFNQYDKILDMDNSSVNHENLHYSFVPLEIEYLEHLRKTNGIQVSIMRDFCLSLDNADTIQRISLCADDIATFLDNVEFDGDLLDCKMNPYRLSAIMTIKYRKYRWWSDDVYDQFREFYD